MTYSTALQRSSIIQPSNRGRAMRAVRVNPRPDYETLRSLTLHAIWAAKDRLKRCNSSLKGLSSRGDKHNCPRSAQGRVDGVVQPEFAPLATDPQVVSTSGAAPSAPPGDALILPYVVRGTERHPDCRHRVWCLVIQCLCALVRTLGLARIDAPP